MQAQTRKFVKKMEMFLNITVTLCPRSFFPFSLDRQSLAWYLALVFLKRIRVTRVFMDTEKSRLQVIFNSLFEVVAASPLAFPRPPMTKDDFPDYVEYLRALIGHERRTRQSCEDAVTELITRGTIPTSIGAWERYFLDLRIQAALIFLEQCGCSEHIPLPVRVVLPDDNREWLCQRLVQVCGFGRCPVQPGDVVVDRCGKHGE